MIERNQSAIDSGPASLEAALVICGRGPDVPERVKLVSSALLTALRRTGTTHLYADTADVEELRFRLARTRWTDQVPGAGARYGDAVESVREMARYWAEEFDWRAPFSREHRSVRSIARQPQIDLRCKSFHRHELGRWDFMQYTRNAIERVQLSAAVPAPGKMFFHLLKFLAAQLAVEVGIQPFTHVVRHGLPPSLQIISAPIFPSGPCVHNSSVT